MGHGPGERVASLPGEGLLASMRIESMPKVAYRPFDRHSPDRHEFLEGNRDIPAGVWFPSWDLNRGRIKAPQNP